MRPQEVATKLRELWQNDEIEDYDDLAWLVTELPKNARMVDLFKRRLQTHSYDSIDELGTLEWHHTLIDAHNGLLTANPEENPFYIACRSYILEEYDRIYSEFKKVRALYDAALSAEEEQETRRANADTQWYSSSESVVDWRSIDRKHSAVTDGFVYILDNELMPDVVKIGFTTLPPAHRARSVTSEYGLPKPFRVAAYRRARDPFLIEQAIQQELEEFRVGRELFRMNADEARDYMNEVIERLGVAIEDRDKR